MPRALLVLSLLASTAAADKPPSRSVTAASSWLSAMTEPGTSEPTHSKKHALAFTVQSDQSPCAKLKTGKATSQAEIKALKACFVATWNHVAKEADLVVEPKRPSSFNGDQKRYAKTAPKGTTWVVASRSYAGQDLTVNMALGPDFTVLAVWFVYLEHDGE